MPLVNLKYIINYIKEKALPESCTSTKWNLGKFVKNLCFKANKNNKIILSTNLLKTNGNY